MIDWTEQLFLFCERSATGLWEEPLNLWTNLAFPVAAILALRSGKKSGLLTPGTRILAALLLLLGVAGALMHSISQLWTQALLFAVIMVFVVCYVYQYSLFVARKGNAPWMKASAIAFVIAGSTGLLASVDVARTNPAILFVPSLLAMVCFAIYHSRTARAKNFSIWLSVVFLFIGLALRVADSPVCEYQVNGTHYLWHVCAAVSLYFALVGLMATRMDARHFRSDKVKGFYKGEKIQTLDPHDVVEFD